ncbi:hypothetical protein [Methylorubrum sp. SL192]|uniref:hypothetical protein n=1 Tax=Methylorubrum sp. SL192 TaxID=2995167 RepID=UPI002275CC15|nr:hypothetical protein [Methylorubrum sp. SL192]MCY1640688.1 hypothetical protein [Methylorubrum sp. SL192]
MSLQPYGGATPEKHAKFMIALTLTGARSCGQKPVKALNDLRTEILAEGRFDEHDLALLKEVDARVGRLVAERWQWV